MGDFDARPFLPVAAHFSGRGKSARGKATFGYHGSLEVLRMAQLDRARLAGGIVLALTAACSSAGVLQSTTGGDGGKGGTAGHGGSTTSSSSSTTTSSSVIATSTGVGGAGGGGLGGSGGLGGAGAVDPCNPAPAASTLWAQAAVTYPLMENTTLCAYTGEVLLVVNTAAI
jgi:hypothetical protein